MSGFMAGAGRAELRLPDWLMPGKGNFARVLDPLQVRVVLLQGQKRAALVSLELMSLPEGIEELKAQVAEITGTDPSCVWITVTHTFSAPALRIPAVGDGGGPGGLRRSSPPSAAELEQLRQDQAGAEALYEAVGNAALAAALSLQPARLGWGSGLCGVNAGRDVLTDRGWWPGEGSREYVDQTLTVLRIDTAAGRPLAVVYNYAVQSSVLDHAQVYPDGYAVTGDLAGRASAFAEARCPGMTALFLCGAAADQVPRRKAAVLRPDGTMRTILSGESALALLDSLGSEFGAALCNVIAGVETEPAEPEIQAMRRYFPVAAKDRPSPDQIRPRLVMTQSSGELTQTCVELLRIGEIALVGVRTELSASVGQEIRHWSACACTMIVTMVNGSDGYMADALAYQRCTCAAQNSRFGMGASERLCIHALAMLHGENPALTAYNAVYGEGARNTALILASSGEIRTDSVRPEAFSVAGRQVLRAYASTVPEPGTPADGRYVILELNPVPLLAEVENGHGAVEIRRPSLWVRMTGQLERPDGSTVPAWPEPHVSVRNVTAGTAGFRVLERDGLRYQLYLPDAYDPARQYPLVLFLHDAGCRGSDPEITLYQGAGPTAFAAPAIQHRTPCLVLAPQIPARCLLVDDAFRAAPELEKIMAAVCYVADTYAVDRRHITITGQSMGCMGSCELLMRYPDFFAGALLVAGQWDPAGMAEKALNNTMWILVSAGDQKAFSGMNAVTEALERAGAKVVRDFWNGRDPQLVQKAAKAAAEPWQIRYTVFEADSVLRGDAAGPSGNHTGTWAAVYELEPVLHWLVTR